MTDDKITGTTDIYSVAMGQQVQIEELEAEVKELKAKNKKLEKLLGLAWGDYTNTPKKKPDDDEDRIYHWSHD